MGKFLRPSALDDALCALAAGRWTVLAGGTDHYPARVVEQRDEDVLDITGMAALRGITNRGDHWRLGALTTWADIASADLAPAFRGLQLAAREVGGAQIQNRATIAGNLCNASPAADGVPPLMAMDAEVELSSKAGTRLMPVGKFIRGNRQTDRRPDELLTAIRVPKPGGDTRATFLKLGARRYLVISIVMVAGVIERDASGRVAAARLAVGACSAVAQRLEHLEAALIGQPADAGLARHAVAEHLTHLAPIDDARGSGSYRREAALVLVRRCLAELGAARQERAA
jgi:CO/xanthine dehydrogenase FAD-binding subunit